MRTSHAAQRARQAGVAVGTLALATLAAWILEGPLGIANAAIVYVAAVAIIAIVAGTPGAVAASVAAILLYDFFFTAPVFTLRIEDPEEWLNVLLLLFVAILVGQLTAVQRRQTAAAEEREHEARAMFGISRALATRESTAAAIPVLARRIVEETVASRVWVETQDAGGGDRVIADTDEGPRPSSAVIHVVRRTDGDAPAEWTRVHLGTRPGERPAAEDPHDLIVKVPMEAAGRRVGAVWALVPRAEGLPAATDTRLLAAVGDQLGLALEQDRLAREARDAEVARESDRAKTALLETVSHDLRTPLASIRAAAGTLLDRDVDLPLEDRYATAETIDRDAERLNRIVTNLLDLSRVEAGALHADIDGYDLADLVEVALDRVRPRLGARRVTLEVAEVPPVRTDPAFLDQILGNLLENVVRYAGPDTPLRITARAAGDGTVRLTVEDGGPGVPDAELERLFEKFYRVSRRGPAPGAGSGVGLAVVRGFAHAMGARVAARRSELGGLAVDLHLPVADAPAGDGASADRDPQAGAA
jgi:two-component system sensor histidine kinase KdpD